MLRLLPVPVLMAVLLCHAHAAEVSVHASRQDDVLYVEASAEFEADVHQVWQVLTDYDRLSDFIPGMSVSRVVTRGKNVAVVEQKGEATLLFFTFPMEVRLAVNEFPYDRITSHAVAGNFRDMRNAYYLEARRGRIRLSYSGRMTPDFLVPPLIGTIVFRMNVEKQFSALIDEILRRKQSVAQRPAAP